MLEQKKYHKHFKEAKNTFCECVFDGIDFSSLDLSGFRFLNCRFVNCNWTATKLEKTRLQEAFFVESKVMGVDFTLCDSSFISLHFEKCLLRGCNFSEMPLKGSTFIDSEVKECHFVQTNLEKASFKGSNLEGSLFHNTKCTQANFLDAYNYTIDPTNCPLKGAKFSKPEALSLLTGLGIKIE